MKTKTFVAAFCLSLLPVGAFAMCSGHDDIAASCAEGYVWDAEKETCVETVSS